MSTHNSKNLFTLAGSDCGEDQRGQRSDQSTEPTQEFGAAYFTLQVHATSDGELVRFLRYNWRGVCNGVDWFDRFYRN